MIVKQIWTANPYRNFNYLVACAETGEALAIDPLDSDKCLKAAKDEGWDITQILNTHEHHDHIGGNDAVVAATGAKVLAHAKAGGSIPGMFRGLMAGDIIRVGKTVELEALDTPGHTMCHICLCAHTDYIENNLRFTLDREPDNQAAQSLLNQVRGQNLEAPLVTTLAQEREVNTFFRLGQASVIDTLRQAFPDLPVQPDEETVFVKLRELRNSW
jgi:hydroxyacylglutathione hydrolase